MKTIKEMLVEAKCNWDAQPELGEIAYDINGDAWTIKAYCYADGGAPEGCDSLKSLLRSYDASGAMKEMLDCYYEDLPEGDDSFIVGAETEKDGDVAAWVWGDGGLHYCHKNIGK